MIIDNNEIMLAGLGALKDLFHTSSIKLIDQLIDNILSTNEVPEYRGGVFRLKNELIHSPGKNMSAVKNPNRDLIYKMDYLHNISGPARITKRENLIEEEFFLLGMRHNSNGPAIKGGVYSQNPDRYLFLFGQNFSKADYEKMVNK